MAPAFPQTIAGNCRRQNVARARERLLAGADDQEMAAWNNGGERSVDAALETFVARENVARYRRMLAEENDLATGLVLQRMLAEEEARLTQSVQPAP